MSADELFSVPGYVCPICGADCSPIGDGTCAHYFLTDGENGWRFSERARDVYEHQAAEGDAPFRDALYHDASCREHLTLRRAIYDDDLEIFVYSANPDATIAAFTAALGRR